MSTPNSSPRRPIGRHRARRRTRRTTTDKPVSRRPAVKYERYERRPSDGENGTTTTLIRQGTATTAPHLAQRGWATKDNAPQSFEKHNVGDVVLLRGNTVDRPRRGVVKYIGPIAASATNAPFVGVELDEPRGRNDGSLKGVRYFTCRPLCGVFAKAKNVQIIFKSGTDALLNHAGPHSGAYDYHVHGCQCASKEGSHCHPGGATWSCCGATSSAAACTGIVPHPSSGVSVEAYLYPEADLGSGRASVLSRSHDSCLPDLGSTPSPTASRPPSPGDNDGDRASLASPSGRRLGSPSSRFDRRESAFRSQRGSASTSSLLLRSAAAQAERPGSPRVREISQISGRPRSESSPATRGRSISGTYRRSASPGRPPRSPNASTSPSPNRRRRRTRAVSPNRDPFSRSTGDLAKVQGRTSPAAASPPRLPPLAVAPDVAARLGGSDRAAPQPPAPASPQHLRRTLSLGDLEQETDALIRCAQMVTAELDLETLFSHILHAARELVEADRCSLFLLDENSNELYSIVADDAERQIRFAADVGIAGHVMQTGEMLHVDDAHDHPLFNAEVEKETGYVTRDILCLPILHQGDTVVGVIQMINSLDGFFDANDVRIMRLFTNFAAIGLNNAYMYERQSLARRKTALVFDFAKQVAETQIDLSATVSTFMARTRELVHAERCTVWLIDEGAAQLYTAEADGEAALRIPLESGVAGAVATSGATLNIRDAYADPRFNPEVDARTGFKTKAMLCMPIACDGRVIGVVQMINKTTFPFHFTADDEEVFSSFSSFCALSINKSQLYEEARDAEARIKSVLEVAMALADSRGTIGLVSDVMTQARELINADRFSLYTLDPATSTLRVDGDELDDALELPADVGLAGFVVQTGKEVSISDAYLDPRFNQDVDQKTGYRTKSVLAVPVRNERGDVIAVAQLLNKRRAAAAAITPTSSRASSRRSSVASVGTTTSSTASEDIIPFTKNDRDLVRAFCDFISGHVKKPAFVRSDSSLDVFLGEHEVTAAERAVLLSPHLQPWTYSTEKLIAFAMFFFEELGLVETFSIRRQALYHFLCAVSRRYHRENPYHNFIHCMDVTHAAFLFIRRGALAGTFLKPLDCLVMLTGCLLHDVDHQGFSNNFHAATSSPFAIAYGTSIMERHHIAIAVSILSDKQCNILTGLSTADYKEFWQALCPLILATDAANKDDDAEFEAMAATGSFVFENAFHRRLFMRHLVQVADISNGAKPLEIARYWADCVTREFFAEGDLNRELGLAVPPHLDRTVSTVESVQIGFLRFMARGAFVTMARLVPGLSYLVDQVDANLVAWEAAKAEKDAAAEAVPGEGVTASP